VNNPTLTEFCFGMIGRADIEGSKSNVAMNAWLPQASYPCGTVIPIAAARKPPQLPKLLTGQVLHLRAPSLEGQTLS
jgi:hypothetical protein